MCIGPSGKPFTEDSIGMALATRDLMGICAPWAAIAGGPHAFSARDRSVSCRRSTGVTRAMRAGRAG